MVKLAIAFHGQPGMEIKRNADLRRGDVVVRTAKVKGVRDIALVDLTEHNILAFVPVSASK